MINYLLIGYATLTTISIFALFRRTIMLANLCRIISENLSDVIAIATFDEVNAKKKGK